MRAFKIFVLAFMLLFIGSVAVQAQTEVSCLDGKGQALIYPYYNITNPAGANYLRVVNTAGDQGVGVKVRLRRASDSQECFNFYLCLSAKDEWSGWIIPVVDVDGNVVGGRVVSGDRPNDPETPSYPDLGGVIPPQFLDPLCQEGYVEIISAVAWSEAPGSGPITSSALCQGVMEGAASTNFYPDNVLIGDMHLIDADRNADSLFAYNATALANFRDVRGTPVSGVSLAIDSPPTWNDALPGGVADVDAALAKQTAHIMHTTLFRQNGVLAPYTGQTDFIVLFPTKRQSGFGDVSFKAQKWDNAEHSEITLPFFSPEPAAPPTVFPRELNYVRIGADVEDDPTIATIFQNTDDIYWGNIELRLMDQALLDLIQRDFLRTGLITEADLVAVVPTTEHGYLDLTFLEEARPAIVLKFERITDFSLGDIVVSRTDALEAQYTLP
jgi:hypothetical protein